MVVENELAGRLRPLEPQPTQLAPAGRLAAPVACVLFDVYGTLFISAAGDIGAPTAAGCEAELKSLLAEYAIEYSPRELIQAYRGAIDKRHGELRAQGIDYPEVDIEAIWRQVLGPWPPETIRSFAIAFELMLNPVYPMPHLAQTLSSLAERALVLGIISNAQFYTPLLFPLFLHAAPSELGFHPELLLYSYRCQQAKPAGDLFRTARQRLERLGVAPRAVLYIGNDMLNDIYPACQVGFQTGLFAGDARSLRLRPERPECRHLSADLVVTDLLQIVSAIDAAADTSGRTD
jgi:putative hydrolase of the HAD superfamily